MKESKKFRFNNILFALVLLFILIQLYPSFNRSSNNFDKLGHVEELYKIILNNYHKSISEDTLVQFIRDGIFNNLDPFTQYISKEDLMRINEDFAGDFYGIGVQFSIIRDTVTIIKVIDNGPSQKENILSGDRIIKVNAKDFTGPAVDNDVVMNTLRGARGEKVELTILRKNNKLKKILYRDAIPLNSVDSYYIIKDDIGYIKLEKFSSTTFDEFRAAIFDLKNQGAKKLILDLRNNGGGYLNQAVDVANEFLNSGLEIVSTDGEYRDKKVYYSNKRGAFKEGYLVVLINENSASASEILSGAIQDHDRGFIVGNKSFGKGLVGEQINLKDGGALRITVAKYYTPSGRSIQKPYNFSDSLSFKKEYKTRGGRIVYSDGGITPDYIVSVDTMTNFESKFWNKNYNFLYEKSFDILDQNRKTIKNNYIEYFNQNKNKFWIEILKLSENDEEMEAYKEKFIKLFENMILNHALSSEELIRFYNKEDDFIEKALNVLSNDYNL